MSIEGLQQAKSEAAAAKARFLDTLGVESIQSQRESEMRHALNLPAAT